MTLQNLLKNGLARALFGEEARSGEDSLTFGKAEALHIFKGMCVALLSGVLGASGAVFSSYPFGIAYLCAADKYVVYSYMGLLVSSLASRGYALALATVYTVCILLRYGLCRIIFEKTPDPAKKRKRTLADVLRELVTLPRSGIPMFREGILVRCAVACFAAFVFGLYRLIAGGFLYYDLFGLLAGFLICPLTAFALGGLFTKKEAFPHAGELSRIALMFISVYALRGYSIFSFSPAFMAAVFITLWAAADLGTLKACAVGLVAGLACGGMEFADPTGLSSISYSIGAAPCIMASVGLCAGLLWKLSRTAALTCACVIGMSIGLVVDGFSIMPRLIPDMICAAAVFLPLSKFGFLPRIPVFVLPSTAVSYEDALILEKKQTDTNSRIAALSEAFAHLSDTLYALSDRMRRPGVADLKQVSSGVFDGFCSKCAMQTFCLEKEYAATLDAESKITSALYKKGRVTIDDVPEYFKDRCTNILPIIDEINLSQARLVEKLIKGDKTEAFAIDYEAISRLLADQLESSGAEYEQDKPLEKKVAEALKYMGLSSARVMCYGGRKKHIIIGGVEVSRMKLNTEELQKAIENTAEIPLGKPCFSIEDDSITAELTSRRTIKAEVARASGIKERESANGDSTAVFENSDDYLYSLISDGMGSGREAAVTSKICVTFAERMLSAGNGKAVTLEMLNGFLRSRTERGGECSATIDMAEIDLITGEACFVKSGAAPSFILRSGNLYKLQSKTIPLGIMRELDAEKIRFELAVGDVIIMLSDGVAQSLEDGVWLANLLTYEWEDDLGIMANKILDNGVFANKRSDDMTALLIRIGKAEEE